jgi:hypothetical protein
LSTSPIRGITAWEVCYVSVRREGWVGGWMGRTLVGCESGCFCFGTCEAVDDVTCPDEGLTDGKTDESRCSNE